MRSWLIFFPLVILCAGCAPTAPPAKPPAPPKKPAPVVIPKNATPVEAARLLGRPTNNPVIKTKSGAQYIDVVTGKGPGVGPYDRIAIYYTLWKPNGKVVEKVDEKENRPRPIDLFKDKVSQGLREGLVGMKQFGIRKIIISSNLGKGNKKGASISPNSTFIEEVELIEIVKDTGE